MLFSKASESDRGNASPSSPTPGQSARVDEHNWPESIEPIVSIVCITYNHRKFIKSCIEGFLMQETDFPVEIIVRDDASTDGTREILKSYREKHPNIFRLILEENNTLSKGIRPLPQAIDAARGKYYALCEGDDYWICRKKLASQVQFLEANPDYMMSAQNSLVEHERGMTIFSDSRSRDVKVLEVLRRRQFATGSVCIRSSPRSSSLDGTFLFGDTPLFLDITATGKVFYENRITSVYRRHEGGVTAKILNTINWAKRRESYNQKLNALSGNRYDRHVRIKVARIYSELANHFQGEGRLWASKVCRGKSRSLFPYLPILDLKRRLFRRMKKFWFKKPNSFF